MEKRLFRSLFALLIGAGLGSGPLALSPAAAQSQSSPSRLPDSGKNRFEVATASVPVKVDGFLDDPAWAEATVIPLTHEWLPGDNTPPPVKTDCLVTHDSDRLYVAFRAYDPNPEQIRLHLSDRDFTFLDDSVGFLIDTFRCPPPGLLLPHQPPRGAIRLDPQRCRRLGGHLLERHLGLRRQAYRRRLCGGGGPPLPAAAVPGLRGEPDLGLSGGPHLPPVRDP